MMYRFVERLTATTSAMLGVSMLAYSASAGLPENFQIVDGIVVTDGFLDAAASGEPRMATVEPLPSGWHRFSADYRTEGFEPSGRFAMDVKCPERQTDLSTYNWIGATPDWAPVWFPVKISGDGGSRAQLRLCDWQQAGVGARVQLRKVTLEPFDFAEMQEVNWLEADFASGRTEHLPAGWYWHTGPTTAEGNGLVPNTSFRTGAHVLRVTGETDKFIELRHRSLPLPEGGEIKFSLWARAAEPRTIRLHVVQDGWAQRAQANHTLSTAWQRYEVVWKVPSPRERDHFFPRIDVLEGEAPVEFADLRMIWTDDPPMENGPARAEAPVRVTAEVESGVNWLEADFASGQTGHLPEGWHWHAGPTTAEDNGLVPNTSFRTGAHVLRIAGEIDQFVELRHRHLPLPEGGEITFSLWARAAEPRSIRLHIVQEGWAQRAQANHTLSAAWQPYEVVWKVPLPRERDRFFPRIDVLEGDAPVEFADLRLIWTGDQPVEHTRDHTAALERGWQGVPGANLLYNPQFELGGQGYFYDFPGPKVYDHYKTLYQSQPIALLENQGVDGGTCAFVSHTALRTYNFPVTVGQTYTMSADFRAPEGQPRASVRVRAFDAAWNNPLNVAVDDIGSEWKRHQWTFTWDRDNVERRGYIRFDSPGILIDRIQVVEGTLGEYAPPPVMLGMVYDRWPYFVRGRDELSAAVRVVPGVQRAGQTAVTVTARDAWGAEVWTRSLEAPLDRVTNVAVDLPEDRLGVFHIELKAVIDDDTAGIGIGRYAIIDPPWLQPQALGRLALAGVCQENFGNPLWLSSDHAVIQSDIGIRWNRLFARIPDDLSLPIPVEFSRHLNATAEIFKERDIELMPCVNLTPHSLVSTARHSLDMPSSADLAAFADHLHAYVDAVKENIRYWEIFNEPNLWRVPRGPEAGQSTMFPKKYLEFQKVAHRVIKGIDQRLLVVAPALNNVRFDWIEEWMQAGAGDVMDLFSFHPYSETDFFQKGIELEEAMHGFGFTGPLVNTEKYFGADLFYDRQGHGETSRGYYLPHDGELKTAGRSIQHFVSSAAVGVPVAFFYPVGTISRRGPGQELFLYDFFAAYNAAIRFVAPAGRGGRVELGPTATAIVFPDAPGGPIVVLWTPQLNIDGSLRLAGDFVVYDIMGNVVPPEARPQGVRVASDPSYVRFPEGSSTEAIRTALLQADLYGMGDPFHVAVSIGGGRNLTVWVESRRNRPLDGTVRVVSVPEGWTLPEAQTFADLEAAAMTRIDFDIGGAELNSMEEYPVSVLVESGEEFVRTDTVLRPVFARRATSGIVVDGNLDDWENAEWITLDANHLARPFDANQRYGGPEDHSAEMALLWTPEALALAVVVTDDRHHAVESPSLAWQGDSVQIYFDPLNDAMPERHNTEDDIAYILSLWNEHARVWLAKGAEGNYRGEANRVDGLMDVDAQCVIVREGNQTVYELLLPLNPCLPGVTLEADTAMGFSLLINDNDGQGRKTGLTLAPPGTEPYGAPHLYRDLILIAP